MVHLVFSRTLQGTWGPRGLETEKGSARGRYPGRARSIELSLPHVPVAGRDHVPPATSYLEAPQASGQHD